MRLEAVVKLADRYGIPDSVKINTSVDKFRALINPFETDLSAKVNQAQKVLNDLQASQSSDDPDVMKASRDLLTLKKRSDNFNSEKVSAQKAVDRIMRDTTTRNQTLGLTNAGVFALMFQAASDTNSEAFVDHDVTADEIQKRQLCLIKHLAMSQNEYATNHPACWMGTRNQMVASLDMSHVDIHTIEKSAPLTREDIERKYGVFCKNALAEIELHNPTLFQHYLIYYSLRDLPGGFTGANVFIPDDIKQFITEIHKDFSSEIIAENAQNTTPLPLDKVKEITDALFRDYTYDLPALHDAGYQSIFELRRLAEITDVFPMLIPAGTIDAAVRSDEKTALVERIRALKEKITDELDYPTLYEYLTISNKNYGDSLNETIRAFKLFLDSRPDESKKIILKKCWPKILEQFIIETNIQPPEKLIVEAMLQALSEAVSDLSSWLSHFPEEIRMDLLKKLINEKLFPDFSDVKKIKSKSFIFSLNVGYLKDFPMQETVVIENKDCRGMDLSKIDLEKIQFKHCHLGSTNIEANATYTETIALNNTGIRISQNQLKLATDRGDIDFLKQQIESSEEGIGVSQERVIGFLRWVLGDLIPWRRSEMTPDQVASRVKIAKYLFDDALNQRHHDYDDRHDVEVTMLLRQCITTAIPELVQFFCHVIGLYSNTISTDLLWEAMRCSHLSTDIWKIIQFLCTLHPSQRALNTAVSLIAGKAAQWDVLSFLANSTYDEALKNAISKALIEAAFDPINWNCVKFLCELQGENKPSQQAVISVLPVVAKRALYSDLYTANGDHCALTILKIIAKCEYSSNVSQDEIIAETLLEVCKERCEAEGRRQCKVVTAICALHKPDQATIHAALQMVQKTNQWDTAEFLCTLLTDDKERRTNAIQLVKAMDRSGSFISWDNLRTIRKLFDPQNPFIDIHQLARVVAGYEELHDLVIQIPIIDQRVVSILFPVVIKRPDLVQYFSNLPDDKKPSASVVDTLLQSIITTTMPSGGFEDLVNHTDTDNVDAVKLLCSLTDNYKPNADSVTAALQRALLLCPEYGLGYVAYFCSLTGDNKPDQVKAAAGAIGSQAYNISGYSSDRRKQDKTLQYIFSLDAGVQALKTMSFVRPEGREKHGDKDYSRDIVLNLEAMTNASKKITAMKAMLQNPNLRPQKIVSVPSTDFFANATYSEYPVAAICIALHLIKAQYTEEPHSSSLTSLIERIKNGLSPIKEIEKLSGMNGGISHGRLNKMLTQLLDDIKNNKAIDIETILACANTPTKK